MSVEDGVGGRGLNGLPESVGGGNNRCRQQVF